jgi:hypothetical protein
VLNELNIKKFLNVALESGLREISRKLRQIQVTSPTLSFANSIDPNGRQFPVACQKNPIANMTEIDGHLCHLRPNGERKQFLFQ